MVDLHIVCCLCGDIGFPDKLFRCNKCSNRFQHSYCSNYYEESSSTAGLCDWCLSKERSGKHVVSSKRQSIGKETGLATNRSEYSNEKIKQNEREENAEKGKNTSGTPSPRPASRRYKSLKDVMC
ncbi:zinc ion-binding protein [Thalictrum thalictroides]|uniref:Zinc ion-binding protein n=1 Tax=Thalictrum thalictroides TaxID=46969 RepID=A0A7J6V4T8_THATH|nr:zinc ion-binding protein [Thalictrum thalictroides]